MNLPIPKTIEVSVQSKVLNDLQILHLSDLHIGKKTSASKLIELVNICNNLKFDFAVITGDIIDCKVRFIKDRLAILNSLNADVYYISGNHDLFYGLEELKSELKSFIFMDNQYKTISYNNETIHIAGLPDRFSKFFGIKREEKKIIYLLKGKSASIFISHQPKDYKIALDSNASLFLCGHTHGGQIYPFHFFVRLFQPFLNGISYIKKSAIYVSSGLGNWGINFRYKAPNEITILKLISKIVQ